MQYRGLHRCRYWEGVFTVFSTISSFSSFSSSSRIKDRPVDGSDYVFTSSKKGARVLELISPLHLRTAWSLSNGDLLEVEVEGDDEWWGRPDPLDVVYQPPYLTNRRISLVR